MKKDKKIQEIWADALYWATSPKSKKKKYHLTRVDESILRKLIHYSRKNEKITYSNELISKHTFLSDSQLRKSIPRLDKKGYIRDITFGYNDENGKHKSRRIINILWSFIETVLADIPKDELPDEENEVVLDETELDVMTENNEVDSNDLSIPKIISTQNESIISTDDNAFTPEQLLAFENFTPPNDGWSKEHIKMEFAKQFVTINAKVIIGKCKNKFEFDMMIDNLIEYDLQRFKRQFKDIDKSYYKSFIQETEEYIKKQG
jgi:DNA-binding Lrp family transcriptional regulator